MVLLDNRKKRILQAIVDDYIDTAEPIGSRTIARKHQLGLSSATIRNEMADLEEMGYLAQPYTSAGRVPSDKGYRLYVDELMKIKELSAEESENIKKAMETRVIQLEQLVKLASSVVSRFTKYTSMAMTLKMVKITIKTIQVIPVEQGKALIVIVTSAGIVKNKLIRIPENLSSDLLIRTSNMLNGKLMNMTIEQVGKLNTEEIRRELGTPKEYLIPVLNGVIDCINRIDDSEIYLEGVTNIFNYPEYRDIIKAKEFLKILDEKDVLCKLLNCSANDDEVVIHIGTENEIEKIRECSLITAAYSVGDVVIGSIGVIGPTRMEYAKVVSAMNFIKKSINSEILKLFGDEARI